MERFIYYYYDETTQMFKRFKIQYGEIYIRAVNPGTLAIIAFKIQYGEIYIINSTIRRATLNNLKSNMERFIFI